MASLLTSLGGVAASAVQPAVVPAQMGVPPLDPLSLVIALVGALLTVFSVGFFAYLALGAFADLFTGDGGSLGRTPPPQR